LHDRLVEYGVRPLDVVVKCFLGTNSSIPRHEQQAPAGGRIRPANLRPEARQSGLAPPSIRRDATMQGKTPAVSTPAATAPTLSPQDLAFA